MDASLTYRELRERAEEYAEVGGYSSSSRPPNWPKLINQAYEEFVVETDAVRGTDASLLTVVDQATYTLPAPAWKLITVVLLDGRTLTRTTEGVLAIDHPTWLVDASARPVYYWRESDRVLRVYPAPDTAGLVFTLRGIRSPAPLAADDDLPAIPNVYHEALAIRAYQLAATRWARGEERAVLLSQADDYLTMIRDLRGTITQDALYNMPRTPRGTTSGERVAL